MEEKRSEQELVRIAKLEKYKELGIDPFGSKKSSEIKLFNDSQSIFKSTNLESSLS